MAPGQALTPDRSPGWPAARTGWGPESKPTPDVSWSIVRPSAPRPSLPPAVDRLLPFAVSFTFTCIFFINICDWIFDCGCRSLWAGADAWCNVHVPESRHCPFCSRGVPGYAVVLTAVSLPQLAVAWWSARGTLVRIVVCVLLVPAAMFAIGVPLGWYDGYWQR
jgi:hypothetical protein